MCLKTSEITVSDNYKCITLSSVCCKSLRQSFLMGSLMCWTLLICSFGLSLNTQQHSIRLQCRRSNCCSYAGTDTYESRLLAVMHCNQQWLMRWKMVLVILLSYQTRWSTLTIFLWYLHRRIIKWFNLKKNSCGCHTWNVLVGSGVVAIAKQARARATVKGRCLSTAYDIKLDKTKNEPVICKG